MSSKTLTFARAPTTSACSAELGEVEGGEVSSDGGVSIVDDALDAEEALASSADAGVTGNSCGLGVTAAGAPPSRVGPPPTVARRGGEVPTLEVGYM